MNIVRPARCLICSYSRSAVSQFPRQFPRQFHSTPISASRKPKHENVKASDLEQWEDSDSSKFPRLSSEEKARLEKEYSSDQMAAVEAGEKAINPEDMANQFASRRDPWKFQYLDDFSAIEPAVDHHIRAPLSNYDSNSRLKTEEESDDDLINYIENMSEDDSSVDFTKFTDNLRLTVGDEEAERNPHSALVPDIFERGETLDTIGQYKPDQGDEEKPKTTSSEAEESPRLKRLMMATGYTIKDIRGLRVKTLLHNNVANQTRLGKVRKSYFISVAGNGRGLLGLGEGKGEELVEAQVQSQYRAIRNMQPILRYENRTIFGDLNGKVGATTVLLQHRPPGRFDIHKQLFMQNHV